MFQVPVEAVLLPISNPFWIEATSRFFFINNSFNMETVLSKPRPEPDRLLYYFFFWMMKQIARENETDPQTVIPN
ncbi:hypothetical protein TNIN_298491 [Trichonephila inaurata madagascariensis]|uniref:Uncharacterized protein n=1 Tax=Trichonephila inaurata madagascariensis TaxID=2747483 RepID=A0A8X6IAD4_9ARAC|nr:hypothetical protein TNIN_298491 [Trichonephila inaurata madagascariensis]